jgi:hypothetical protein
LKKLDPYFVIKLPNGKQLLYRCGATRWEEMIDVVKYFKEEYGADICIAHIHKREAKKYMRGKKI